VRVQDERRLELRQVAEQLLRWDGRLGGGGWLGLLFHHEIDK
jgi:hypothetical protein